MLHRRDAAASLAASLPRPLRSVGLLLAAATLLAACHHRRHEWDEPPKPVSPDKYATPLHAGARVAAVTDGDLDGLWRRQLMVPVASVGREQLQNSFTAARDGQRVHHAIDIMAPRGTPIVAADDCTIDRLTKGSIGGIVIYASDPERRYVYYYAHLERYRRGLQVGDRIAKGSVIGYVGTTGNASETEPHLHFQIMKRGTGRVWWDGPPINPFTYFARDGASP